jgi:hypothetical protein
MSTMYGNYQYSLDGNEQSSIQMFLRSLPQEAINKAIGGQTAWDLLHELTYAESWTETPEFGRNDGTPLRSDEGDTFAVSFEMLEKIVQQLDTLAAVKVVRTVTGRGLKVCLDNVKAVKAADEAAESLAQDELQEAA